MLKDTHPVQPEQLAKQAIFLVEKLLDAHIVHGDLSEYNLILWDNRLFVIDFPQAVDLSSKMDRHIQAQKAKPLLLRDLKNLENYFARYGVALDARAQYERLVFRLESC